MRDIQYFENDFDEEEALEIFTSKDAEVLRIFLEYIYKRNNVALDKLKELRKTIFCGYHVNEILEKIFEAGMIKKIIEFSSVAGESNFKQSIFYEVTDEGSSFFEQFLANT
jgi:hypothetical protein